MYYAVLGVITLGLIGVLIYLMKNRDDDDDE